MASTPFATSDDLQERWPSLPATMLDTADVLLSDASFMIRQQYPGIDDQITGGALDAQAPLIVACNMVRRALVSTPGVSQESSNAGPFSHSLTYANPNANVFISAADDALLRGYQPRAGSFTYGNDTAQC